MTSLSTQDVSMFKVIVVGAQSVGKSSILHQFTTDTFKSQYKVTIGVEFVCKQVKIDKHTTMGLQIWDTAGQETFKAIVRSYYRGAAAVFLVYNIANKASLDAVTDYLLEVRNSSHQNVVSVLVGNKSDLQDQRKISYEDGVSYIDENKIDLFFETSAKNGDNVQKAFEEMAKLIFLRFLTNESYKNSVSSIKSTPQSSQFTSKNQTPRGHQRGPSYQQKVEVILEDDGEVDRTSRQNLGKSIKLSRKDFLKEKKKESKCC